MFKEQEEEEEEEKKRLSLSFFFYLIIKKKVLNFKWKFILQLLDRWIKLKKIGVDDPVFFEKRGERNYKSYGHIFIHSLHVQCL